MKKNSAMFIVTSLLLVGLIMLNGCKKSEPAPSETSEKMQEMQEHASMMSESAKEVVSAIEQTDCPVMGGAINKALFTEYEGKKVYFCCSGCKPKFEAEPEKYIAKLPQFNK